MENIQKTSNLVNFQCSIQATSIELGQQTDFWSFFYSYLWPIFLLIQIKMKPHERIRYTFYNLFRKLLFSIGHDFLQKDGFKPTAYTFFMYGLNALGFTSCVYTIIWYDIATALNSIGYGAVNIQVVGIELNRNISPTTFCVRIVFIHA